MDRRQSLRSGGGLGAGAVVSEGNAGGQGACQKSGGSFRSGGRRDRADSRGGSRQQRVGGQLSSDPAGGNAFGKCLRRFFTGRSRFECGKYHRHEMGGALSPAGGFVCMAGRPGGRNGGGRGADRYGKPQRASCGYDCAGHLGLSVHPQFRKRVAEYFCRRHLCGIPLF